MLDKIKNIISSFEGSNLKKSGFSLMEVLGVLFIVMVGMVGVMSLVLQNIQVKDINTNRIIAHQLAQEGVELIRKQRGSNWIACDSIPSPADDCWLSNIEPGDNYKIDFQDDYPEVVTDIDETKLYRITSGEFEDMYTHDITSQETPFYRLINVEYVDVADVDSVVLTVDIQWQERAEMYSYSVETLLYNWK